MISPLSVKLKPPRRLLYVLFASALIAGGVFFVDSLTTKAEGSKTEAGETVVVVDKKTNKLHLCRNNGSAISWSRAISRLPRASTISCFAPYPVPG